MSHLVTLALKRQILILVNRDSSAKGITPKFYIMGLLVEHYKDQIPEDLYKELKERYSK